MAIAELAAAIRAVAAERPFVDPALRALVDADAKRYKTITAREAEVLALLTRGLGAEGAAAQLGVSAATVNQARPERDLEARSAQPPARGGRGGATG
jgi:DNA-binding NarL/FixJ family response regulator